MSIISTVPKGAAVEGINPNLLRNWYFVGGGTGRGVFPVNQRGQSSYTTAGYTINKWSLDSSSSSLSLNSNYVTLAAGGILYQYASPELLKQLAGKTITASALLNNNSLSVGHATIQSSYSGTTVYSFNDNFNILNYAVVSGGSQFQILRLSSTAYVAVKVELGDQQTLAHQENGVWVLNEVPDYETEYYKCVTDTADPTDTYNKQQVSNITVQCNSVGSSSLRYYNKLIQSTHKVLDSTFSNPAAQTSDITVTTYDGYLDFSNGFASGATTNITLVLGTSGPVLSTSTTAPS